LAGQPYVVPYPFESTSSRNYDYFVELRVARDDGCSFWFDKINQMRIWHMLFERSNGWGGKYDVADKAWANEKNFHGKCAFVVSQGTVTV
jgi:hypothetical protein